MGAMGAMGAMSTTVPMGFWLRTGVGEAYFIFRLAGELRSRCGRW